MARPDRPGRKDLRAQLGPRDRRDQQDRKDRLDLRDRQVRQDRLVCQAFQVVTGTTISVSGGALGSMNNTSAACPSGKTAIAGGWNNTVGSVLVSSPSGGMWSISVFVPGLQSGTIQAIAVCAFTS